MSNPREIEPINVIKDRDSQYLTIGELLIGMTEADEDVLVLASDDEDGNEFSPIKTVKQGLYLPQGEGLGYFLEHPSGEIAYDDLLLYEQTTANDNRFIEATLIASKDPDETIDRPMHWIDLRNLLENSDPEDIVLLRSHTFVDSIPRFSPLTEIDTAYYLKGLTYAYEENSGTKSITAERISQLDHYEEEEDRLFVEDAIQNENTEPAYYFWPEY